MRKSILLIIFALGYQLLFAQDIFKKHGFDKKPLTLSNGHYNEFFKNEKIVQIGTILLNTQTNKVVAFLEEDTTKVTYLPEFSSRWVSPDPLAAKYPENSPYVYGLNNPILFIDPNGMDASNFLDKEGNLVSHTDDGSNAVFQQTGTGKDLHYEFTGNYSNQGGVDQVTDKAVTSAIQEQQSLNMGNSALQSDGSTTHCNQATQDVMKTAESATGKEGVTVTGKANDMAGSLATSKSYKSVDQTTAEKSASNGNLVVAAYKNNEKDAQGNLKSGHVATLSVGNNIGKGTLANIGIKGSTGFVPITGTRNAAFTTKQEVKYYILIK